MIRTTIVKKLFPRIVAVAAALTISIAATNAHAVLLSTTNTVNLVEYSYADMINIQLAGGVNYSAYKNGAAGNCSTWTRNIDVIKAWQNIAQTALLSRKTLTIYYDVCDPDAPNSGLPPINYIVSVVINN